MPKTKAILIDITKCIGCLSCEAACKQLHGFPTGPGTQTVHDCVHHCRRAWRSLHSADVHELSGPGLRVGVPGRSPQDNRAGPGYLRIVEVHRVPLLSRRLSVQRAAVPVVEACAIRYEMRHVLCAASERTAPGLRRSLSGASVYRGIAG